jgi:gamma-glutamyltranspeptidase/glutathione hydrolase
LYLAHSDRQLHPVENLVDYQNEASQKTDKAYAKKVITTAKALRKVPDTVEDGGETTHFSVVDKSGIALAVTASINAYFGAEAAAPELGFLYNTYMNDFELGKPGHPFAIRPGAMAYSSMSPTIVQKSGQTVLVLGSPGSVRIISTVAQLAQLWIDSKLGIQAICAKERMHISGSRIYLENNRPAQEMLLEWRKQGFQISFPDYSLVQNGRNAWFGGVHALAFEKNKWTGVVDIRRDGSVFQE